MKYFIVLMYLFHAISADRVSDEKQGCPEGWTDLILYDMGKC